MFFISALQANLNRLRLYFIVLGHIISLTGNEIHVNYNLFLLKNFTPSWSWITILVLKKQVYIANVHPCFNCTILLVEKENIVGTINTKSYLLHNGHYSAISVARYKWSVSSLCLTVHCKNLINGRIAFLLQWIVYEEE
jgi:hypothetical protein